MVVVPRVFAAVVGGVLSVVLASSSPAHATPIDAKSAARSDPQPSHGEMLATQAAFVQSRFSDDCLVGCLFEGDDASGEARAERAAALASLRTHYNGRYLYDGVLPLLDDALSADILWEELRKAGTQELGRMVGWDSLRPVACTPKLRGLLAGKNWESREVREATALLPLPCLDALLVCGEGESADERGTERYRLLSVRNRADFAKLRVPYTVSDVHVLRELVGVVEGAGGKHCKGIKEADIEKLGSTKEIRGTKFIDFLSKECRARLLDANGKEVGSAEPTIAPTKVPSVPPLKEDKVGGEKEKASKKISAEEEARLKAIWKKIATEDVEGSGRVWDNKERMAISLVVELERLRKGDARKHAPSIMDVSMLKNEHVADVLWRTLTTTEVISLELGWEDLPQKACTPSLLPHLLTPATVKSAMHKNIKMECLQRALRLTADVDFVAKCLAKFRTEFDVSDAGYTIRDLPRIGKHACDVTGKNGAACAGVPYLDVFTPRVTAAIAHNLPPECVALLDYGSVDGDGVVAAEARVPGYFAVMANEVRPDYWASIPNVPAHLLTTLDEAHRAHVNSTHWKEVAVRLPKTPAAPTKAPEAATVTLTEEVVVLPPAKPKAKASSEKGTTKVDVAARKTVAVVPSAPPAPQKQQSNANSGGNRIAALASSVEPAICVVLIGGGVLAVLLGCFLGLRLSRRR